MKHEELPQPEHDRPSPNSSHDSLDVGKPLAWVVSDKAGLRQRLLQRLGFLTNNIHHDLHSKGHRDRLLQALSIDKPRCLWVRLAGPCAGSGNKHDAARTAHLCAIIGSQQSAARMVVVEANARSQVWNMQSVRALLPGLCVTEHCWCQYEGAQEVSCSTVVRLATNFHMESRLCNCSSNVRHVDSKQLPGSREDRFGKVLSALASQALDFMRQDVEKRVSFESSACSNQHIQPELRDSKFDATHVEAFSDGSPSPVRQQANLSCDYVVLDAEQAEAFAKQCRLNRDFRCSTCYRIFLATPFSSRHGVRDIASDENGNADCYTFGAYAHGAFVGIIKHTRSQQELVRYVNAFLNAREQRLQWSSLSINHNSPMIKHRDNHNLRGSLNLILCVGRYQQGGLWLELTDVDDSSAAHYRKVGDSMIPGQILDCHDKIVVFSPQQSHGPEPWVGDRWSINAFTSRGLPHLGREEVDELKSYKFPLRYDLQPLKVGTRVRCPRDQFSGEEKAFLGHPETSGLLEFEADAADPPFQDFSHVYPTEGAERRKARIKAGHTIKPKKFEVEQTCDDLGDDLSSLHEAIECVAWSPELCGARSEHVNASDNNLESDFRAFAIGRYRWMHGSSMSSPMSKLKKRGAFTMQQFAHMTVPSDSETVDILEIFGENDRSLWLVIKKHGVSNGWNFDVTASLDLLSKSDVRAFWSYLSNNKPKVIILAPWCPSHFGSMHRSEARLQQQRRIMQFVAPVAAFQTDAGNHFVAEQPACSPMFCSREWQSQVKSDTLHECHFDQNAFGRKAGEPNVDTHLVSSTELLVRRFRGNPPVKSGRCGFHYGNLEHSTAQVWSSSVCDVMAEGVVDCLMASFVHSEVYAAGQSKQCPGCKWHKRKDHPSHDRSENCRFRTVKPSKWSCPGCLRNKPRTDSTHTLDDECQWNTARVMPEGLGRERKGGHPRDVSVPAAAEPTAAAGGGGLRSVGSREAHPEDVPALRARRARASGSDPAVRHRDAEAQVNEGGAGVAAVEPSARESARPAERGDGHGAAVPAPMARANASPVAASADANAPPEDPDRWTSFDLGRALQDLRSIREGVVRRALRKLHIRWFHASAQCMKTLLTAAGVSPEIMVLVQQIVDTCDICRNWTRPGPRTVTSATVTTRFNEEIQVDLLFYRDKIILHMIDRTTRFTVARRIASKHLDNVVEGVMSHWVGMFGPPNRITSDQEGALPVTRSCSIA